MLSLLAGLALTSSPSDSAEARTLVEQAMGLIGGRAKLESIQTLTIKVSGHQYMVEQSERPTGPFLTAYSRGTSTLDFDAMTETVEKTSVGLVYGNREMARKYVIDNRAGKGSLPLDNFLSLRRMALGPERVLLFATQARDLRRGQDTVFNDVPHNVVEFKWGWVPVRLFLKKDTGAPSGVETRSPLPFPWTSWGDVPVTTRWSYWQVLEGGVMTPSQYTTSAGAYPLADETVLSASLTMGSGRTKFALPAPPAKDEMPALLSRYTPTTIVPGVIEYSGPFNTFVVEQPDGLVVIEPVLTSGFAAAFLDKVTADFPGKRVKAVVATDDAWPHFGGFRTFVARGAEVIGLDVNRPLVERFMAARHATLPDELAMKPAKLRYRSVRKPVTVGTGTNRFVLYPVAGQGSERMLMAYFPAHRLLYGSDLLQKQGEGFFFPAYPKELVEAVRREKLDVETVFAEHLSPTKWSVVEGFVDRVGAGGWVHAEGAEIGEAQRGEACSISAFPASFRDSRFRHWIRARSGKSGRHTS